MAGWPSCGILPFSIFSPTGVECHSPARRNPACVLPSFLVLSCVSPTAPPKVEWGQQCSLPVLCLFQPTPPPVCNLSPVAIPPPPRALGGKGLLAQIIESTKRQRRQRKSLQGTEGAESDLHCDTMVQFCGVIPPPPGGETSLRDRPPPVGEPSRHWWGDYKGGVRNNCCASCTLGSLRAWQSPTA